ncbi:uncharacterized protein LOC116920277 isoform X2 [Daphnia magna]|uniref:uncharacterized protein LOC116920277 isoform X2 n=1 Tax=Daphnia magna TaxID=35525 RepID=UPI0014026804|nr:uncharacterized protein LOC116920277 isoform X2 [Daphnia magna]
MLCFSVHSGIPPGLIEDVIMSDHKNKFNDETFWLELLETTQETKFALLPITNSRSSPQVEIRYCRLETKHYSTQSLSSSSVLQRFICSIQQEFNFRVTTALLHAISKVNLKFSP